MTPIQRVCKYPLLLRELLKVTPSRHPDRASVATAQTEMEKTALVINEEKRNYEELVRIQETIEGWEGPALVDTSTRLLSVPSYRPHHPCVPEGCPRPGGDVHVGRRAISLNWRGCGPC